MTAEVTAEVTAGGSVKRKYKVVYDRQNCIGAFACVAVDEVHWIQNEDGKADLAAGIDKGNGIWEVEVELTEEEFKKLKQSAEVCPVTVIHIYDDKGEKIY